jgi:hypothetical protein
MLAVTLVAAGALVATPAAYASDFITAPAITWTGTSVVMAATDTQSGNLDYWWQQAGTGAWTEETVAPGDYSYSPAIAWTGSSVVIAAVGNNGYLYYFWQAAGSTVWHQETVSTGNFLAQYGDSVPSIAWSGSSVLITAASQNGNNLYYWWQAAGTSTWHQELVNNGYNLNPHIVWAGNKAEIVTATLGSIGYNYYWQADGSPSWNSYYLDGQNTPLESWYLNIAAAGDSAVMAAPNLDIAPNGENDADLWLGTQPSVGAWSFDDLDNSTELVWGTTPAIVWNGSSADMAAPSLDGNLYYWFWVNIPSLGLQTWLRLTVAQPPGPGTSFGDAAMTLAGGTPVIADAATNGILYVFRQDASGWSQQAIN